MKVRKIALDALMDITDHGAYANLRLKSLPESISAQERARINALVYTTLEHLIYIDWLLAQFVSGRQKPVVRAIFRLACCELFYFNTPAHAVASEYVSLTREVGKSPLTGFVNGVLRNVDRARTNDSLPPLPKEPVECLSVLYSFPAWLVAEWVNQYGIDFCKSMLAAPGNGTCVRAQFPYTTEKLLDALPVPAVRGKLDENALLLECGTDVTTLPQYLNGQMSVQGQSAMLCCRALGDCSGMHVLDCCAAPGGKSAYLASLCKNDVRLTALELHPHRVELMQRTFERLHVSADLRCHDLAVPISEFNAAFDIVLLDAPCSGLGLLLEKPDIRYTKTDADIIALSNLQKTLLSVAACYVKKGGILLYATCTISKRENEDNVLAFLSDHREFCLEHMPLSIDNDGMLQLFPHIHGTEGFFMARMHKCI